MNQRIVLTLKELKELLKSIENFDVTKDELENVDGNEDFVTISVIRSESSGELIYKIIH